MSESEEGPDEGVKEEWEEIRKVTVAAGNRLIAALEAQLVAIKHEMIITQIQLVALVVAGIAFGIFWAWSLWRGLSG